MRHLYQFPAVDDPPGDPGRQPGRRGRGQRPHRTRPAPPRCARTPSRSTATRATTPSTASTWPTRSPPSPASAIPDQDYGGFVERLRASAHRALPGAPALAGLLQAVVFETLITAVLNEVPGDPSVVGVVRDLLRDHARDEGRHHRFFAALFRELWTHLSAADRTAAAHALPELIRAALTWDLAPVRASLRLAGPRPRHRPPGRRRLLRARP
ncbi:diiron oxygenase [Streptomyces sp. L7]